MDYILGNVTVERENTKKSISYLTSYQKKQINEQERTKKEKTHA